MYLRLPRQISFPPFLFSVKKREKDTVIYINNLQLLTPHSLQLICEFDWSEGFVEVFIMTVLIYRDCTG